jgi:uncharacterized protein YqeY
MSIEATLLEDMKAAMKRGDSLRVETIRLLRAQIKNASLGKEEPLPEADVLAILSKEAKKRKEAIVLYQQGGRDDLVQSETRELEIIHSYLPEAMNENEIDTLIRQCISQAHAEGMKDIGKVMSMIMPQIKGRADGKMVQERVRTLLS